MDLQDFWQENKRWVLGVVAGLIVYWIGSGVVAAVFGGEGAVRRVNALAASLQQNPFYDSAALAAAREENERLQALATRVREHVAFVPDDEFVLAGKGDADLYFPDVERRVRQRVVTRAQERSVSIDERDLSWPVAVARDEKEATLIGLCVLQHAALRLIDAGEAVRQRLPDAIGLQSIESFAIEKRGSAAQGRRGRRPGDSELADIVEEHRVKFRFRADVATLQAWLETLRAERPSVGLAPDLHVIPGDQIGDPVLVHGILSAVVLHELSQDG